MTASVGMAIMLLTRIVAARTAFLREDQQS